MEQLIRGFNRVVDACAWLACLMLIFQVVSVSVDVILRFFFGITFAWITALNEWSLVFVAFLGAAWLEREDGHTSDDTLIGHLGPQAKSILHLIGRLIGIAVCAFLVWYGTKVTWDKYATGVYDFFKMESVRVFWIYWVIPFGSALWLVQLLLKFRRSKTPSVPSAEL